MFHQLAISNTDDVDHAKGYALACGRDAHKLTLLGAAPGHADYHLVAFGEDVINTVFFVSEQLPGLIGGSMQVEFEKEGYQVGIKLNDRKTVNSAFVRFNSLLYEFGLSAQRDEVLAVKIEVDTHPPAGAGLDTTLIRRHATLRLHHHDRASLLAGKLHALFQRRYDKGRDLYDLMWYLTDPGWPSPNLTLLRNALQHTGWDGPVPDKQNWRDILHQRLEKIEWNKAVADVKPFLERADEVILLTRENFANLLDR